MIAEKFHTMASLGDRDSRVKDLWDVVCLARRFAFDGDTVRNSIAEDLRCRRDSIGRERPATLLPACYDDIAPARYCQVLQRRTATGAGGPTQLVDARQKLRHFLEPVCDSMIAQSPFTQAWPPGGLWLSGMQAR